MMRNLLLGAAGAGALALTLGMPAAAERAVPIPAPLHDVPAANGNQVAVLAGGCFWGMEAVFEHVKGVQSVTAGY
ncbi:peptide-methionine (S)-S-oxide reductase, partial [Acinetobacter baumannii]